MERTCLINGNGKPYFREIPKVYIYGPFNDVALEHLRENTEIDFKRNSLCDIEGQPYTWEHFARIFLTYNFLTHDTNNSCGNIMYLRTDCNTPLNATLRYRMNGQEFIGVQGCD